MTNDPERQKELAEQRRINLQKKQEKRAIQQGKIKPGRIPYQLVPDPGDLTDEDRCNHEPWRKYLDIYPLIHAINREYLPLENLDKVTITYFNWNKGDNPDEIRQQFSSFFHDIGYEFEETRDVPWGLDGIGLLLKGRLRI